MNLKHLFLSSSSDFLGSASALDGIRATPSLEDPRHVDDVVAK